jgi:hypothetical protein
MKIELLKFFLDFILAHDIHSSSHKTGDKNVAKGINSLAFFDKKCFVAVKVNTSVRFYRKSEQATGHQGSNWKCGGSR